MALELIAESLLSAAIEVLAVRISSQEVKDFFTGQKLDDGKLKKLKLMIRSVGKLLTDAEAKQITDSDVREWLDDLKDAIYESDDFLDEISYKALQSTLEAEPRTQTCTDQVRSFLTSLVPCKQGMGETQPELEKIIQNLEDLLQQKDVLGLIEHIGAKPSSQKIPTTSLVDESGVYGREADKEAIMKLLLSDDAKGRRLDVIPIVGMGGMGKTTLAQQVYNDTSVRGSFDIQAWVYVSEELDLLKVTRDILKGVGTSADCDKMTEDQLHCELEKKLNGKTVFLVLDDVWSDDHAKWEFMLKPFNSVRQGSKVVVTTRNANIAQIKCSFHSHRLQKLTDDVCWRVLASHAFDDGYVNTHSELEEIGKEIASKCDGLPLAAKTLGALLRSKTDVRDWRKILASNLWELRNDNVLSALRLSYYYLPSHLKQCFAYCAIFPKGYEFDKNELVLLWMGEGFLIHPKGNEEMEEVGLEYFHDLVSRSFFQQPRLYSSVFTMHDLINDLARFVSGEFCFQLEGNNSNKTIKKTRHLSYWRAKDENRTQTLEAICDSQLLRTFIQVKGSRCDIDRVEVMSDLLKLKRLRVLSIYTTHNIYVLLDSIGNLRHLRYLRVYSLKRLPESICSLYNLQILILVGCHSLVELPANMRRLINLCHLDISNTDLQEMPPQMGKLVKLRTLTDFFVGKQSGSSMKELGKLQHLHGKLQIWNLQNVVNAEDALEAGLKAKEHLEVLMLTWRGDTDDSPVHERVLDQLQPHVNLKRLLIFGYGGTRFLNWVYDSSPPLLEEVYISRCPNLRSVFSSRFPSLKILHIRDCKQLEFHYFSLELFPNLKSLQFTDCPNLVSFISGSAAPNLTRHLFFHCAHLKSLPEHMHSLLPCLVVLELFDCPELESFPEGGLPSKLQSLQIWKCDKLIAGRMQWVLQALPSLSEFMIRDSWAVEESFPEEGLLPSSLNSLELRDLIILKSLNYKGLQRLTSLRRLEIHNCCSLRSMPEEGLPSTLSFLHIHRCPLLEIRCEKEKGEDWPKISHIPNILINWSKIN